MRNHTTMHLCTYYSRFRNINTYVKKSISIARKSIDGFVTHTIILHGRNIVYAGRFICKIYHTSDIDTENHPLNRKRAFYPILL